MKQFKGFERKEQVEWEQLPKGAYVIKLMNVKEEANKNSSGTHLAIAFDIAEGEYQGFYKKAFENDTRGRPQRSHEQRLRGGGKQ